MTIWFVLLCALDWLTARLIGAIGKHYDAKIDEKMVKNIAWLNPLSIIACGGLSPGILSNSCKFTVMPFV